MNSIISHQSHHTLRKNDIDESTLIIPVLTYNLVLLLVLSMEEELLLVLAAADMEGL